MGIEQLSPGYKAAALVAFNKVLSILGLIAEPRA